MGAEGGMSDAMAEGAAPAASCFMYDSRTAGDTATMSMTRKVSVSFSALVQASIAISLSPISRRYGIIDWLRFLSSTQVWLARSGERGRGCTEGVRV